ncbi:MAG: FHA domain-containing protein [bacterium]|nr:FHA domain-containing protein [bacterium]
MDVYLILWLIAGVLFVLFTLQTLYLFLLALLPTRRRERPSRAAAPYVPPAAELAYAPQGQAAFAQPPAPMQPPTPVQAMPTPLPTPAPRPSASFASPPVPQAAPPAPPPTQPPPQRAAPAPVQAAPVQPAPAQPVQPAVSIPAPAGSRKLVVLSGLPELYEINLPGNEFGIGRFFNQERKVLVMFDEKSISREHAVFTYNAPLDQYFVTDKSSSYGTFVLIENKFEPLTPERPERILNGDVVQFGNAVKVRFILPGETRASVTSL